jgi:hypothetical protein
MALRLLQLSAIRAAVKEAGAQKAALVQQLDAAREIAIASRDASALVEILRTKAIVLGLLKND